MNTNNIYKYSSSSSSINLVPKFQNSKGSVCQPRVIFFFAKFDLRKICIVRSQSNECSDGLNPHFAVGILEFWNQINTQLTLMNKIRTKGYGA